MSFDGLAHSDSRRLFRVAVGCLRAAARGLNELPIEGDDPILLAHDEQLEVLKVHRLGEGQPRAMGAWSVFDEPRPRQASGPGP